MVAFLRPILFAYNPHSNIVTNCPVFGTTVHSMFSIETTIADWRSPFFVSVGYRFIRGFLGISELSVCARCSR